MKNQPFEPNQQSNPNSDWVPCPNGQLRDLSRDLGRRRQSRAALKYVASGVAVLLLGISVYQLGAGSEPLTCEQARSHAASYWADSVSTSTRRQVDKHLTSCPSCQDLYDQRRLVSRRNATLTGQLACESR
jgi:hypothetical protein